MTWLKVCDTALHHPKVFAIHDLQHAVATASAVIGMVTLAASWSGAHDTDHFIAEQAVRMAEPRHHEVLSEVALTVGLWTRATQAVRRRNGGQAGYVVKVGEGEVFHLLTREQKATQAAHRRLGRTVQGRIDLHLRDGDQCRYCAVAVEPNDRKTSRGRTWDHPDPAVADELVVACRGCNLSKAKRTAAEWLADGGRPLMPEPARRGDPLYLAPQTLQWLASQGVSAPDHLAPQPLARTAPPAADAANRRPAAERAREQQGATRTDPIRSRSDPDLIPAAMAGHARPGRVGKGQVGSGRVGTPLGAHPGDPPSSGPPRARGRRGRRGRGAPPS